MIGLIEAAEYAVKECERLGADEAEGFTQKQRTVEIVLELSLIHISEPTRPY